MLVIANGAFKSGSTWLVNIIKEMADFTPFPQAYANPVWPGLIRRSRLRRFLEKVDYRSTDYLTKNHLFSRRWVDLLAGRENVYVLDITRDLRDVVVSYYYHLKRQGRAGDDFARYYWRIGRYKAYDVLEYHRAWDVDAPNVYCSSFERLNANFGGEVRAIGAFLGLDLSDEQIDRIGVETSMRRMRRKWGEDNRQEGQRFLRKGAVGDWKSHMDARMLADLDHIRRRGLSPAGLVVYRTIFTVLRGIKLFAQSHSDGIYRLLYQPR